jgi:4-alpha-glucanotransferase
VSNRPALAGQQGRKPCAKSGILIRWRACPGLTASARCKPAFAFIVFLKKAGQKVWQMLPLSPTGFGDSPYQSCSAFAGNPYFIDLDILRKKGLLKKGEYGAKECCTNEAQWITRLCTQHPVRYSAQGFSPFFHLVPDDYYRFLLRAGLVAGGLCAVYDSQGPV